MTLADLSSLNAKSYAYLATDPMAVVMSKIVTTYYEGIPLDAPVAVAVTPTSIALQEVRGVRFGRDHCVSWSPRWGCCACAHQYRPPGCVCTARASRITLRARCLVWRWLLW